MPKEPGRRPRRPAKAGSDSPETTETPNSPPAPDSPAPDSPTPQSSRVAFARSSSMAFLSPGVYVQEVPSAVKAIAGVSTSTPGFIGIVPSSFDQIAKDPNGAPDPADPTKI